MKENRTPRLLTVLIVGGTSLLMAAMMLLTPPVVSLLRGAKTVILPSEDTVIAGDTAEPTPTVPINGLAAPAPYAPEVMFWIAHGGDPADIMTASIPAATESRRPNARLVHNVVSMTELVGELNDLLPSDAFDRMPQYVSQEALKGVDHYTLRYGSGERDAVTFYKNGFFAYVGNEQALDLRTDLGYDLLATAYKEATESYSYENGIYEQGFAKLWRPSTSKLRKGGRIYRIGDDVYCYPMTASEAFEHRVASSHHSVSLSSDDVTYLTELIDAIASRGWIAAVPADRIRGEEDAETQRLQYFNTLLMLPNERSRERETLLAWLLLFSDTVAVCSVEGEGEEAVFATSFHADDFWYFPSLEGDADVLRLLWHYQDVADRSKLDYPVFRISAKEGVQYYRSLAENEPEFRGLKEFVFLHIPEIPSAGEDILPKDAFVVGRDLSLEEILKVDVDGSGDPLPKSCRLVGSVADMQWFAEHLNAYDYRKDEPILLSELRLSSRILIRFGKEPKDVVTVYAAGYVSFGHWDYAWPVRGEVGYWELVDRYDAIAKWGGVDSRESLADPDPVRLL